MQKARRGHCHTIYLTHLLTDLSCEVNIKNVPIWSKTVQTYNLIPKLIKGTCGIYLTGLTHIEEE